MSSLTDLKSTFEKQDVIITDFTGWQLFTETLGVWTLKADMYFQDGVYRSKDDIKEILEKYKKAVDIR